MAVIRFNFLAPVILRDRHRIRVVLKEMFSLENTEVRSVDYIFCSDDYLLKINREFLQHDFYTDVITFVLSASTAPVEAEIYISADRVLDNANQLDIAVATELRRVILHGALHLCGYRDKTKADIKAMRGAEERYLVKCST